MTERSPRFALLDSLRAIAALMVLVFHLVLLGVWEPSHDVSRFLVHLNAGVPIFFVISGFLLYRPFLRGRRAGERPAGLWPYAARRATRIFPAYWLALYVGALLVSMPGVFDWPRGLLTLGLAQVYSHDPAQGLPQAWSICVELSFYAFLPLWAWAMRRVPARSPRAFVRTEAVGLLLLFAAGLLWKLVIAGPAIVVDFQHPQSTVSVVLPNYLDQFALGMGLALASVALQDRAEPPRLVRAVERWPGACWLVALGLFLLLGSSIGPFPETGIVPGAAQHEVAGLFGVAMVLPAVFGEQGGGGVRRVLALAPLVWMGLVSYGVYLWQVTAIRLVNQGALTDRAGSAVAILVAVAGTLLAAAASWYGLERYAIALGRRAGRGDHTGPEPAGERIEEAHAAVAAAHGRPAEPGTRPRS